MITNKILPPLHLHLNQCSKTTQFTMKMNKSGLQTQAVYNEGPFAGTMRRQVFLDRKWFQTKSGLSSRWINCIRNSMVLAKSNLD